MSVMGDQGNDEKKRPVALNLAPARTGTSSSSSSTDSSLKVPRTPRFAEATSVSSPVQSRSSPFADPETSHVPQSQPGDVGFGYINNHRESVPVPMTPKSPLKSAMKVPGTPARQFTNPLSPTFREEDLLEKQELDTEKVQAKDMKIKTRVRMAKFALRGVHFSCSLIILAMLSSSFAIFNATRNLPAQSKMPAWAVGTDPWAQKLVLAMSCLTIFISILVFLAYCRGGHKRAQKVATYYTMFSIGWFIVSLILWVLAAAVFSNAKNNSNNQDLWGWSCVQNTRAEVFSDKVKYTLVCRLQDWTLICIIIEVVVETITIMLYSVVFYRFYSKRRLRKSMGTRDQARSDLYLAQLRVQSAPNTPGFPKSPTWGGLATPGLPPKSPALSQYAMSPRHPPATFGSLSDIEEQGPITPTVQTAEPQSQFSKPQPAFKLQAPPLKAPSATPKNQSPLTPISSVAPSWPSEIAPVHTGQHHVPVALDEPIYEAVPIPGAYTGAAIRSPPPAHTYFGQAS